MSQRIAPDTTSPTVAVFLVDTAGQPATAVAEADVDVAYRRPGDASFTDVASPQWNEIDDARAPGWYGVTLPDAAAASGAAHFEVGVTGTDVIQPGGPEVVTLDKAVTEVDTKAKAVQDVLQGITRLRDWLRAKARKDAADPTALSEIGGDYDPTTDSLEAIRDRGDSAWITGSGGSGGGNGPIAFTATVVEQGTSPAVKLENATVLLVEAGGGVAQASGKTDAQGEVELGLNEATYDVVVVKDGFSRVVTQHTITADAATHAETFGMQRRALPASDTPGFCNCVLRALDITGDPKPGAVVRFQMARLPERDQTGEVWTGGADVTADAQGDIETKLPQLTKVRYAEVDGNIIGAWTVALVPAEDAAELPSVLGFQN